MDYRGLILQTSENTVERVRQLVQILCLTSFNSDVTKRELDVLYECVMFGYSKEAVNSFMLNHKTTKENFSVIADRLTTKGILLRKKHKQGKDLHPDFVKLKELYFDGNSKFLIVTNNNNVQE